MKKKEKKVEIKKKITPSEMFGPKTSLTQGPEWPFICLDIICCPHCTVFGHYNWRGWYICMYVCIMCQCQVQGNMNMKRSGFFGKLFIFLTQLLTRRRARNCLLGSSIVQYVHWWLLSAHSCLRGGELKISMSGGFWRSIVHCCVN